MSEFKQLPFLRLQKKSPIPCYCEGGYTGAIGIVLSVSVFWPVLRTSRATLFYMVCAHWHFLCCPSCNEDPYFPYPYFSFTLFFWCRSRLWSPRLWRQGFVWKSFVTVLMLFYYFFCRLAFSFLFCVFFFFFKSRPHVNLSWRTRERCSYHGVS